MIKLYIYRRLPDIADSKLLRLFISKNEFEGKLFQKIPSKPFHHMVKFVSDVKEADYILMPHDYLFVTDEKEYLEEIDNFAVKSNKKIIVHLYGDSTEKVPLKQVIILRPCSYRTTLSSNEIIVPSFIEDLGEQYKINYRHKNTGLPIVGFAGMVGLATKFKEIKYQIKIFINRTKAFLNLRNPADLQGLYFRRMVIKKLSACKSCIPNFVIRNTFSAHEKTVSKDPAILRQEYVDVIQNCDLGLVVRGDGNYSLRLFEVLSLGRVPLFIDTDTPLPMEDEINYDEFMLRVDYKNINRLPVLIRAFWKATSAEQFIEMQKKARSVFESHLRPEVFYKKLFEGLEQKSDKTFS